jgi:beta-lactamase regulating signal transducer with metallopeptidase domain
MIAAWMLYTVAISLLLFAGARAAEHLARAVGAPTRFVWAAAITAAMALSGRALSSGRQTRPGIIGAPNAGTATSRPPAAASVNRTVPGPVERLLIIKDDAMRAPTTVSRRVDVAPLDRWNDALLALWATASAIAIAYLFTLLARLHRLESRLRPSVVDARQVLLSNDVGPAVLGIVRSRIVLPEWVLSLPRHERHFILAHERQHADAFDPALLCAAALAIALQPWNAGLWAMIARLKLAIESDCDRRVLSEHGDARTYGRLLVAVYQRTMHGHTPDVAFVQRPSNLERRILRMTRAPRLLSVGAGGAALAATVLCTAAWVAPTPSRAATVRTLERVDQARQIVWRLPTVRVVAPTASAPPPRDPISLAVPSVQVASGGAAADNAMPLVAGSSAPKAWAYVVATQTSPCLFAGLMGGTGMQRRRMPREGCAVDGEILVLAVDDSHILVAARDSSDMAFDGSDYVVFGTAPGAVPPGLNWSTRTGHLQVDHDWYIASPSPDRRALAFIGPKGSAARYPDAEHFPLRQVTVRRNGGITWDMLRRLPSSPRCVPDALRQAQTPIGAGSNTPVIYVDGVLVDDLGNARLCFEVDGHAVYLW